MPPEINKEENKIENNNELWNALYDNTGANENEKGLMAFYVDEDGIIKMKMVTSSRSTRSYMFSTVKSVMESFGDVNDLPNCIVGMKPEDKQMFDEEGNAVDGDLDEEYDEDLDEEEGD